jgi:hypothetical protein
MVAEHGDRKKFGEHYYTMVKIASKKAAEEKAEEIREEGNLARVTIHRHTHVSEEAPGSYFAGHFHGSVKTYAVWKGPKRK